MLQELTFSYLSIGEITMTDTDHLDLSGSGQEGGSLSRRRFFELTVGGLVATVLTGCGKGESTVATTSMSPTATQEAGIPAAEIPNNLPKFDQISPELRTMFRQIDKESKEEFLKRPWSERFEYGVWRMMFEAINGLPDWFSNPKNTTEGDICITDYSPFDKPLTAEATPEEVTAQAYFMETFTGTQPDISWTTKARAPTAVHNSPYEGLITEITEGKGKFHPDLFDLSYTVGTDTKREGRRTITLVDPEDPKRTTTRIVVFHPSKVLNEALGDASESHGIFLTYDVASTGLGA